MRRNFGTGRYVRSTSKVARSRSVMSARSRMYELSPQNGRKSFYGKAKVMINPDGSETLYSYDTPIMTIYSDGTMVRHYNGWTTTTGTHIKSFSGLDKKGFMNLPFEDDVMSSRKTEKKPIKSSRKPTLRSRIMASTPMYDTRMDERFDAEIPDTFEIYVNTSRDYAYCMVDDYEYKMVGPNIARAKILIVHPERYYGLIDDIEQNLDRYMQELFDGSDYGAGVDSIKESRDVVPFDEEVLRACGVEYDEDNYYGMWVAEVSVWSTEHDDFADDAYFD